MTEEPTPPAVALVYVPADAKRARQFIENEKAAQVEAAKASIRRNA